MTDKTIKKPNNIKKLRMALEIYKLKDFAKMVGTSATWASRWENGLSVPSLKYLTRIMEILHTDLDGLFKVEELPKK